MSDPHSDIGNLAWSAEWTEDQLAMALDTYFDKTDLAGRARAVLWTMLIAWDWVVRYERKIERAGEISSQDLGRFLRKQVLRHRETVSIANYKLFHNALNMLET